MPYEDTVWRLPGLRRRALRLPVALKIGIVMVIPTIGALVALWSFSGYLDATSDDVHYINVAGRQRMLTVQLRARAHRIWVGHDDERGELSEDIDRFDEGLRVLRDGGEILGDTAQAPPGALDVPLRAVEGAWGEIYPSLRLLTLDVPRDEAFDTAYRHVLSGGELLDDAANRVVVAFSDQRRQLRDDIYWTLATIAAMAITLFALGIWMTSRFVVKPVLEVNAAALAIAGGDFTPRLTVRTGDELAVLADSFNSMVEQIANLVAEIDVNKRVAQAVLASSEAGMVVVDGDLQILRANDEFCDLVNVSNRDVVGTFVGDVVQSHALVRLADRSLAKERPSRTLIFDEIPGTDGEERMLRATWAPMRSSRGSDSHDEEALLLILEDLSEVERLLAETRQANVRFERAVENITDAFLIMDHKGHLTYFNAGAEALFGYTRFEVLGGPAGRLFARESRGDYEDCVNESLRVESPMSAKAPKMGWGKRKSGERIPIEWSVTSYRDDDRPTLVAVARERIARYQAEKERLVRLAALDAAAESIMITDRHGRIEHVNRAFTRLNGYTLQEIKGQTPSILRSEFTDESVYRELWSTILAGRVWRGNAVNQRADGTMYSVALYVAPVFLAEEQPSYFVGIQRELGEVRSREQLAALTASEHERGMGQSTRSAAVSATSYGLPKVDLSHDHPPSSEEPKPSGDQAALDDPETQPGMARRRAGKEKRAAPNQAAQRNTSPSSQPNGANATSTVLPGPSATLIGLLDAPDESDVSPPHLLLPKGMVFVGDRLEMRDLPPDPAFDDPDDEWGPAPALEKHLRSTDTLPGVLIPEFMRTEAIVGHDLVDRPPAFELTPAGWPERSDRHPSVHENNQHKTSDTSLEVPLQHLSSGSPPPSGRGVDQPAPGGDDEPQPNDQNVALDVQNDASMSRDEGEAHTRQRSPDILPGDDAMAAPASPRKRQPKPDADSEQPLAADSSADAPIVASTKPVKSRRRGGKKTKRSTRS